MRIYLQARLEDLRTHNDCRVEARRLVPDALRAIGEALVYRQALPELTQIERLFLVGAAGRRFANRANAKFKRQLEQKLFERIWWAAPFPQLRRNAVRS